MSGKEYKWSCSKDLYVGSVCLLECKYKQNDNIQVDGMQVKCNEEENWMVNPNNKDFFNQQFQAINTVLNGRKFEAEDLEHFGEVCPLNS